MFVSHAAQYFRTHRLNEFTITTALGAGRLLSNGLKTTPGVPQADKRVASIVNEQLKKGIQLPVINQITFDPATFVPKVKKQLKEGILRYSYLKGDENSLLIFVHRLYNTREPISSVNETPKGIFHSARGTGVFFEASAALVKLAAQQDAKRAFVQFVPENKDLFHILCKKYPSVGHHPFYFPHLPQEKFFEGSSPVLEITQAIHRNRTSYLHVAPGTALITNSDCQSLSNEMGGDEQPMNDPVPVQDKNQQEKK